MFKAAFWSSFDKIFLQIINFAVAILIARFLGPEKLGVVAIVSGYVYFLNVFVDSGLTISIIRNRNISEQEISSIFYFNFFLSIVFILLTFSVSYFLEDYFKIENLGLYLDISAFSLLFNSIAFVRYAKLEQNMKFQLLSFINVTSSLFAGIVCYILLLEGLEILAVVIFALFSSLLKNTLYLIFTPRIKFFKFNFQALKPHLIFGKNLLVSSSIEAMYSNGLPVLITKLFTGYDAGIFFQSKRLLDGPINLVSGASRRLFLPAASKLDNDLIETNKLLLQTLKVVNFVLLLLLGILFINAEFIILSLMGEEWYDSILILRILLVGMLFYPSFFLCIDVFKVQGDSGFYSKMIIYSRFVSILLVVVASIFGFTYLVVFFSISQLLMFIFASLQLSEKYNYSYLEIFKTIFPYLFILILGIVAQELIYIETEYTIGLLLLKSLVFCVSYLVLNIYLNKYNPLKIIYLKFKK